MLTDCFAENEPKPEANPASPEEVLTDSAAADVHAPTRAPAASRCEPYREVIELPPYSAHLPRALFRFHRMTSSSRGGRYTRATGLSMATSSAGTAPQVYAASCAARGVRGQVL